MRLTLNYLALLLATIAIRVPAAGQNLVGTNIRVKPSTIPTSCNTGDIRADENDSFKLKTCRANTWITMLDSSFPSTGSIGAGSADTVLVSDGVSVAWQKLNNINLTSTAAITDTKLATISTSGKVANSATTATDQNVTGSIVLRNASGNFTAGQIWAFLNGTAAQAGTAAFSSTASFASTASAAGTAGTASFSFVSGTASFAAVSGTASFATASVTATQAGTAAFASAFNGTISIAQGGTQNGTLSVTNGGILYTDGTKVMNMGAGTSGQSVRSAGAGTPVWRTVVPLIRSFTAAGAGVYTPTSTAIALMVEVQGAGGGGGCSGTAVCVAANGTASVFGSFTAAAGLAGSSFSAATAGLGGTKNALCDFSLQGGQGGFRVGVAIAGFTTALPGAAGGNSFFGPLTPGGEANGGPATAGIAGAGGSAPGPQTSTNGGTGGGGGSYCRVMISTLSATYAYTVGAGGTAGVAVGNGANGGKGGDGLIVVTEFY